VSWFQQDTTVLKLQLNFLNQHLETITKRRDFQSCNSTC